MKLQDRLPGVDEVREALRSVVDPEVGMNIIDLGLVYRIDIAPDLVRVEMTMTSASCPMGGLIAERARAAVSAALVDSVAVDIVLVWDPPWTPDMMSENAKQTFGWPG